MKRRHLIILATAAALGILAVLVSCGGGGGSTSTSSAMAQVTTVLSDPTTCGPPNGIFSHVYVTVTDVKIHQSSTAGPNDPGWVDLTPGISPQTIDLLGNPNNQCFLAQLSNGAVSLSAGSYQQIRIMLASTGSPSQCNTLTGNAGPNCVVPNGGSAQPLLLSSQDQTGLKIPSGQIAGGTFTVAAGQAVDLDVHFDACASIVAQGNGQYRLKPVLLAGAVSVQTNLITGQLVDTSNKPLTGLVAIATLQQKDTATGFDLIKQELTVDPTTGKFNFCPLLISGNADLVVVAYDPTNKVAYAASVVTGVAASTTTINVQMKPVTTGTPPTVTNVAQSSLNGEADTSTGTAVISEDVTLTVLQDDGTGLFVTIPILPPALSSTPTITTLAAGSTGAPPTCTTANSDCQTYTLLVPPANPFVAAAGSTTFSQSSNPMSYKVMGTATKCTPQGVTVGPVTPTPGGSATMPIMNFTGCS